jgi:hypothetical protein
MLSGSYATDVTAGCRCRTFFSVGYGQHTEETREPERYRCEECGARTAAYPADNRPESLDPATNYVE